MSGEPNVAQTAMKLVRAFDEEAGLEALMQASDCCRMGDDAGEAFWLRVRTALDAHAAAI